MRRGVEVLFFRRTQHGCDRALRRRARAPVAGLEFQRAARAARRQGAHAESTSVNQGDACSSNNARSSIMVAGGLLVTRFSARSCVSPELTINEQDEGRKGLSPKVPDSVRRPRGGLRSTEARAKAGLSSVLLPLARKIRVFHASRIVALLEIAACYISVDCCVLGSRVI